jgi:GTP-binding protein
MNYQHAKYLMGAAKVDQIPKDSMIEVAFAGRSNAGKSSALNVLTNQKSIARTSKQPGRTQLLNYFTLAEGKYLVDLPGYGYAKVPLAVKKNWQKTLEMYLTDRDTLKGIVLLVDSRHPMKEFDAMMVDFAYHQNTPLHILLTKTDKLSNNQKSNAKFAVEKALKDYGSNLLSVQLFSSLTKAGLSELETQLDEWFDVELETDQETETSQEPETDQEPEE